MNKEMVLNMTNKERVAIYKDGEKQTIHFGRAGSDRRMIKKRAVVFGDFAVDNFGQVLELTNEMGGHVQGLSMKYYQKWQYVID